MQQQIKISLSILFTAILIAGAFLLNNKNQDSQQQNTSLLQDIVQQTDGEQVVRILALGGYSPRKIIAQAGKPLKIEIETRGTYDCSTAFVIPALKYKKQLPSTGITTIEIPAQPVGSTLQGLCGMGMYSFMVEFK